VAQQPRVFAAQESDWRNGPARRSGLAHQGDLRRGEAGAKLALCSAFFILHSALHKRACRGQRLLPVLRFQLSAFQPLSFFAPCQSSSVRWVCWGQRPSPIRRWTKQGRRLEPDAITCAQANVRVSHLLDRSVQSTGAFPQPFPPSNALGLS